MRAQRRSLRALLFATCLVLLAAGRAHGAVSCVYGEEKTAGGSAPRLGSSFGVQCHGTDDPLGWTNCAEGTTIRCTGRYKAIADGRGARCYDNATTLSGTPEYCSSNGGGGGGGGGCALALGGPQEIFVVRMDGEPVATALPKSSFVLNGMEAGDDKISYLMEEWAVIGTALQDGETAPRLTVLKASSPAFAAAKLREVELTSLLPREKRSAAGSAEPAAPLLLVEAPIHPHNSRYAPKPGVKLSDNEVPAGMPAGSVLIRADFSEKDDATPRIQVLYADFPMSRELRDLFESRLELDRRSTMHHRTVVFATLTAGDVLELKPLVTVTPKCCCGDWFCD
jgi:hypothetical protein